MLNKVPIKKEYLFFAGVLLLALICYQLAFKKTLEAWQTNKRLRGQQVLATNLTYQPGYLKRKNANMDSVISRYQVDTLNFRNNSISTISIIAEKQNVKLSEVSVQAPAFRTEKFIVQKLTFEGDFFSITKTLNDLQKTNGIGVIRSISYRLSRTAEVKLLVDVYTEILK